MKNIIKDKKIINEFLEKDYPKQLMKLGLFNYAHYVNYVCDKFLANKNMNFGVIELTNREVSIFDKEVMEYNNKYLTKFYNEMKNVVKVLKKYYSNEGNLVYS